ncbi:11105_t:CDS:2, partial [Funneliformis caledonium]
VKSFTLYNNIPQIGCGKYPERSLLEDEDVQLKVSSYLRKTKYNGNDLEQRIDPILNSDKKLHILVTHNEITFQSNDGLKSGLMLNGEQPLRKKGQRRSIHVSDFLIDTIGRLKLNDDQVREVGDFMHHEACVMINP